MKGRTVFLGLFGFLVIFGAGLFYAINFAYYERADHANYQVAGLDVTNYREINANTSPIKFRACFELPPHTELYAETGDPTPLVAPYWFDCFDAKTLTEDLASGEIHGVAFDRNEPFGVTSYLTVYEDGRGFAWRQLNECGEAQFSGETLPENCEQSESE